MIEVLFRSGVKNGSQTLFAVVATTNCGGRHSTLQGVTTFGPVTSTINSRNMALDCMSALIPSPVKLFGSRHGGEIAIQDLFLAIIWRLFEVVGVSRTLLFNSSRLLINLRH